MVGWYYSQLVKCDMGKKLGFWLVVVVMTGVVVVGFIRVVELVYAQVGWEMVDVSGPQGIPDGTIDANDANAVMAMLNCPALGNCPNDPEQPQPTATNAPAPTTPPSGQWAPCAEISVGTQVISDASGAFIRAVDQYQGGYVFTGSPYNALDIDPEPGTFGFAELDNWERGFIEGQVARLENKTASAMQAGLGNDYEYLAYGPEYEHGAGEEALWPESNVAQVEAWAEAEGKRVLYAPSRQDYENEDRIAARGDGKDPLHVLADVAQHVDIWGIQLGFLQGNVDDGAMSEAEFDAWLSQWHDWIKVGDPAVGHPGNPNTKIMVQMGISKYDLRGGLGCLDAEPPEYVLTWRERMAPYVDGLVLMPSQQCQPCPDPMPNPEFICTNDPEDIAKYQASFDNAVEAVRIVCGP